MRKCQKIQIDDDSLIRWRFFLYSSIIIVWIAAFLTFVINHPLRHILHLFFLIGVNNNLETSIPAWICKKRGFGGTCNCDFYEYNDFIPMIVIGVVGTAGYAFLELQISEGLILLGILLLLSLSSYYLLPKKDLEPLKYPPKLMINQIDDLQAFLMSEPQAQKKLLVIVDAKCDFCSIQIDEMLRIPTELLEKHVRIYDMTYIDKTDPIIPMTLNLDTSDKIPVPTTMVFDSGMAIEQKDGVLSQGEIEAILMQ